MINNSKKLSYCKCCDSYPSCSLNFKALGNKDNILFTKWDTSENYDGKRVDAIYFEKDYCLLFIEFKNYVWFLENNYDYCSKEVYKKIDNTLEYFYRKNNLERKEAFYPCISYDTNNVSPKEIFSLVKREVLSKISILYSIIEQQRENIKLGNCEEIYNYCRNIIYKKHS